MEVNASTALVEWTNANPLFVLSTTIIAVIIVSVLVYLVLKKQEKDYEQ